MLKPITKQRALLTILVIVATIILSGVVNVFSYSVEQQFAYEAVGQLEDSDSSYEALQVKSTVKQLLALVRWFVVLSFLFLLYKIWYRRYS